MSHYDKEREELYIRQERMYRLTMLSDQKRRLEQELLEINREISEIINYDELERRGEE